MNEHGYHIILADARDFANHDPRKPWFLGGDFFIIPPVLTSFALNYDIDQLRIAVQGAKADINETVEILKTIVFESISRAMTENPEVVAGLILDEAKRRATS